MTGIVAGFSWLTNWTEDRETLRRDIYASKEDCVKDWGEEQNCEQDYTTRARGGWWCPLLRTALQLRAIRIVAQCQA